MRQLLILAIETVDAISIDHIALQVPRLIEGARGLGEIIEEPVTPAAVKAASKRCMENLFEQQNVPIIREQSAAETILAGVQQTLAHLDYHSRMIEKQRTFNTRVLASVIDIPPDTDLSEYEHLADLPYPENPSD